MALQDSKNGQLKNAVQELLSPDLIMMFLKLFIMGNLDRFNEK